MAALISPKNIKPKNRYQPKKDMSRKSVQPKNRTAKKLHSQKLVQRFLPGLVPCWDEIMRRLGAAFRMSLKGRDEGGRLEKDASSFFSKALHVCTGSCVPVQPLFMQCVNMQTFSFLPFRIFCVWWPCFSTGLSILADMPLEFPLFHFFPAELTLIGMASVFLALVDQVGLAE